MAGTFQPPPTYALPILVDEKTGKAIFNPIWLRWFLDLVRGLSAGGAGSGSVTSIATGTGLTGGPVTTVGTIALSNVGTAGTYVKTTFDAQGRETSGSTTFGAVSATIVTAKLTAGGANGSMTFTDGLLTAQTPAT